MGAIERFTEKGIILKDGTEMEADMVIFGTGFRKCYNYFCDDVQAKLEK